MSINKYGLVIDYAQLEEDMHTIGGLSDKVQTRVQHARSPYDMDIVFTIRYRGTDFNRRHTFSSDILMSRDRDGYIGSVCRQVAMEFGTMLYGRGI